MKNSTQITGEIRRKITPDFSHRILNNSQNLGGLTDSVGEMLDVTRGILYAMRLQQVLKASIHSQNTLPTQSLRQFKT